ncbi:MAG: NgoMIV family type II restriction endonuclease [Candidatus Acidiferrales bacterium]
MARSGNISNQPAVFREARKSFHAALLKGGVLCITGREIPKKGIPNQFPSNADGDSATSVAIAQSIFDQIQERAKSRSCLARGTSGDKFEQITRSFMETSFSRLKTLSWRKRDLKAQDAEIAVLPGDVIAPDVFVVREREPDEVIDRKQLLVNERGALCSGVRKRQNKLRIVHASISCKWTLGSDRSEALSLIRSGNGGVPYAAVVTGEPLPSRLASLALGSGDIDCVYHFALPELLSSVKRRRIEDSVFLMKMMVEGERLKDITDLPLDLAVR